MKKTWNANCGTRKVIETTVIKTTHATSRTVICARPGKGVSSLRSQSGQGCSCDGNKVSVRTFMFHLIVTTADSPIRNKMGSGFSISIRTGNLCAMWTQFNSRGTDGTEVESLISSVDKTAQPTPCTLPAK